MDSSADDGLEDLSHPPSPILSTQHIIAHNERVAAAGREFLAEVRELPRSTSSLAKVPHPWLLFRRQRRPNALRSSAERSPAATVALPNWSIETATLLPSPEWVIIAHDEPSAYAANRARLGPRRSDARLRSSSRIPLANDPMVRQSRAHGLRNHGNSHFPLEIRPGDLPPIVARLGDVRPCPP